MRVPIEGLLLIVASVAIGFGAWLITKSRLPAWVKGIWKWPIGDNLTPAVVRMLGWGNVLAGAACLPGIVLLILWDRSTGAWIASMVGMLLVGAASFATIWSVWLSRTKPAKP